MGPKIIIIIFVVIVLGIALFAFHAVSTSHTSFGSWFTVGSSSPFNFSLRTNVQGPGNVVYKNNNGSTQTVIAPPTSTTPVINPQDIPAGFTAAQLSPFFHEIRIGSASAGSGGYYYGSISLYTSLNQGESVDITGWQIKTRNSGEYLPQAVNFYEPGGVSPAVDIRVHQGDTVYLYSSSGPFNLRINKCIGYIGQEVKASPQLPQNCPQVDRSQIQQFTGACQNYINSIGSCQQPNLSSPYIPRNDYACQDFLNSNFTYNSCFNAHEHDTDFLSNQVWVYMGSNVLDSYHDVVDLFDKNGLLVDQYTY